MNGWKAALLGATMLTGGCGHVMPAPSFEAPLPAHPASRLYADVARVDITPPPGVSSFGHGPDAPITDGFWTRLYCRAFVLEVEGGERVAIVPCDLAAMSTLLHRRVAMKLQDILPASRLVLTATHTHAGPAHYFEGTGYTGIGSTKLPGYDDRMTEFLAARIAGAVRAALKDIKSKPARARWVSGTMWKISRNRSLAAYGLNHPPYRYPGKIPEGLLPDQEAIDPGMETLELERLPSGSDGHSSTLGWLSFLAVHPTVLKHTSRLLGADLFGVVSRETERQLRQANASGGTDSDPLHGIVNTNEGDMAVVAATRSTFETVQLGREIAARLLRAHDESGTDGWNETLALASRYLEVDLPGHKLSDARYVLADRAELGAASIFGATDHPTSLAPGADEVQPIDPLRVGPQAPKRPLLGFLQRLIVGEGTFPRRVPLTLMRIGDTWISFVPAEVTVTAGHRIDDAVRGAVAGRGQSRAVVGGLANGYLQYVTTWEEYQYQGYEGASNLYGAATGPLLAEQFRILALSILGQDVTPYLPKEPRLGEVTELHYELGPERERLPTGAGELSPQELGARRKALWMCQLPGANPPALCFAWTDAAPGASTPEEGIWIELVRENGVKLESSDGPIDDRGLGFRTRVHSSYNRAWMWTTLFSPSQADWTAIGSARRVTLRARRSDPKLHVSSQVFGPDALPVECSVERLRACGDL